MDFPHLRYCRYACIWGDLQAEAGKEGGGDPKEAGGEEDSSPSARLENSLLIEVDMGSSDYLLLGDYNVQCYQCGRKVKASKTVRNWQGYRVHPEHNEPRQTQDFVRGVPDNQIPPWVQPWPGVVYSYTLAVIGFGDGATTQFQLGDGLYPTTITTVEVAGVGVSWTDNGKGLITITAPAKGQIVQASGTETMA